MAWQGNYGLSVPAIATGPAVPEPSAWTLGALCVGLAMNITVR